MSKYNNVSFFETTLVTSISKTATSAKLTKARDVVTSEILATGDGTDQTYSGNLDANNIEAGTVVITDGVEEFTDDGLGVLTGDAGGTGTIDYTDGAYTLDFNANVGNGTNITANYTTWLIPSTGGILVFDPETSVAEGIEYTSAAALGTTGATLTIPSGGRGLAVIGEKRGTTRKQQKHTAGCVVKLANFHTYLNQLIRVFQGLDATDDTVFRIGAGANADIYIYASNGDANLPFIFYDASENKWFISNNGVDTYDISAGGSGLTGGEGIAINAGAIDIDLDTNPGLVITAGKIKAKIKTNGGLVLDADGLSVSSTLFLSRAGFQAGSEIYGEDAGGDDTYVIALSPVITAYTDGMRVAFEATTANTTACTLDAGGGAKSIKKYGDAGIQDLDTNDIQATQVVLLIFSTANDCWILQGASFISRADAVDLTDGGVTTLHTHNNNFATGALSLHSLDTERTTPSTTYLKTRDILIFKGGVVNVKFKGKDGSGGATAKFRIYVNDVAVGTERTNATTEYEADPWSEDITIVAGDHLQLYAKSTNSTAMSKEFRVYVSQWDNSTTVTDQ